MVKKRKLKPKKPKLKPKKPIAEIAEATAKAKRELVELRLRLEGEMRSLERQREQERREEAKLTTAKWSRDLSWQSKPPPPEVIYMLIGGKSVRCRLTHQHNMPVYLPDIEEL